MNSTLAEKKSSKIRDLRGGGGGGGFALSTVEPSRSRAKKKKRGKETARIVKGKKKY